MTRRVYPKYKDSGVEWIGEIPEHWDVKRLKYTVGLVNEKTNGQNVDLRYFGLENIESWTGKLLENESQNDFDGQGNLFDSGDVLFGKLRPYLAKALRAHDDGLCTSELLILRPTDIDQNYLFYCILNRDFVRIVDSSTFGAKMPRANWDFIGNLIVQLPKHEEQTQIAAFLDHETSRIDALISKKERQIELLKEKRSALITHAVTKGLKPNAKMKDSGIVWIGEIPAHWEVKRLKRIASLKSGDNINSNEIDDQGQYPVFGGNGLRGYTSSYTHDGHYVLIGRQGALCGNINYANGRFWASEHAVVVTPITALEIFWLGESLRSMNLNKYSVSAAQPGLAVDVIKASKIVVPPLHEQHLIAVFLDRETLRIDKLIDKVQNSIETLKEYRAAIISAAVTGKIDVRGTNKSPAQKA